MQPALAPSAQRAPVSCRPCNFLNITLLPVLAVLHI
jgi:hypothetical protein